MDNWKPHPLDIPKDFKACSNCGGYMNLNDLEKHARICKGKTLKPRRMTPKEYQDLLDSVTTINFDPTPIEVIYTREQSINTAERIDFEILPPGTWTAQALIDKYKGMISADRRSYFEPQRIISIEILRPRTCYIGIGSWSGYHAFDFDYTKKVILESPFTGNATYVIKRNWKDLARRTKGELFDHFRSEYSRVIHSENWLKHLKEDLAVEF